jgi:hypothetical protein
LATVPPFLRNERIFLPYFSPLPSQKHLATNEAQGNPKSGEARESFKGMYYGISPPFAMPSVKHMYFAEGIQKIAG